MHAVRNIRLCTKDCLCLYVCPTGATDTENGQVDAAKCTGCGICANACPSGAISMVPEEYPPQQPKTAYVVNTLFQLAKSKTLQEKAAFHLAKQANNPVLEQLAFAIEKSNRIMAEDFIREAGYMLPQSANTHAFLESLAHTPPTDDFPIDIVKELLGLIQCNEMEMAKTPDRWRCTVCGYIHEGTLGENFTCPRCKQPASVFVNE